jgi:hypothetical protein
MLIVKLTNAIEQNGIQLYAQCHYDTKRYVIMLKVIMIIVIMLNEQNGILHFITNSTEGKSVPMFT